MGRFVLNVSHLGRDCGLELQRGVYAVYQEMKHLQLQPLTGTESRFSSLRLPYYFLFRNWEQPVPNYVCLKDALSICSDVFWCPEFLLPIRLINVLNARMMTVIWTGIHDHAD
jgi:hypothetical protein